MSWQKGTLPPFTSRSPPDFILAAKVHKICAVFSCLRKNPLPNAYAGPRTRYWQAFGKTPTPTVTAKTPYGPAPKVCPDSELIAITIMKPIVPNGRGPLQEVQIGPKRQRHSCATTITVMKPSGRSARGPLQSVEVATGKHGCETACQKNDPHLMPAADSSNHSLTITVKKYRLLRILSPSAKNSHAHTSGLRAREIGCAKQAVRSAP